jgi:hypothetical protein
VSWTPQLATFNSGYPIQQKGKTFAIPGEQSPEGGQAICGLSGHDATKSENLAASFRGLLVLHEITYG